MLAAVEADVYLMADRDLTDPLAAPVLVHLLVIRQLDIAVATREGEGLKSCRGHAAGSRTFNEMVGRPFGAGFTDILRGYRGISRRFEPTGMEQVASRASRLILAALKAAATHSLQKAPTLR